MRTLGGWIGIALAAAGGGYVALGERDFSVTVHRPIEDTYAAFSAVHTFGGGLRTYGFDNAKVTIARPSEHEIVFSIPSTESQAGSRIALTFEPVAGGRATTITAAIDVPAVPYPEAGRNMVLSEAKVEAKFEEAIATMAERLDAGQTVSQAQHELALLLDVVALASNPEKFRAFSARLNGLKADAARIERETQGDRFSGERVLVNESGGMVADVDNPEGTTF